MWARTRRMAGTRDSAGREIMGTLEGGYQRMIDALADRIRSLGGSIETGMTVTDVEPADGGGATLRAGGESRRYDLVFSTLLPRAGPPHPGRRVRRGRARRTTAATSACCA